jgi:hypothetical protein
MVGGFQKSYVIFGGGMSKYLLFLIGVGGWSGKGQKHPYVIQKWPLSQIFDLVVCMSYCANSADIARWGRNAPRSLALRVAV